MRFRKPELIPVIFILCATALLVSLGLWQLERLQWKNNLLKEIEAAQALPATASLTPPPAPWQKAMLTGRYAQGKALRFIGRASNGYVWLAPFRLEDGDEVVLVSLGWHPGDEPPALEEGVQTLEGTLRPLRHARLFSPPNQAQQNLWFTEEISSMQATLELPLTPYVLDREPLPRLRNDHLGYAITWFLLAIAGLGMFGVYYKGK